MVKQFEFNHFGVNTYLVIDDSSKHCAIVDPACESSAEDARLLQYIEAEALVPEYILLTHAHVDHIAGLRQMCHHFALPVTMHTDGMVFLRQAEAYGTVMGFAVDDMSDIEVSKISDGEHLKLGQVDIECRFVPGHCPGSMCFVIEPDRCVLTGDALFHYSIGRTDLPGGDYPTLIQKIKERILSLSDDYVVLPGHGISSQVGKERRFNSFLQ